MFLPSSTLWSNQHFSKSFLILGAIMTQVYFLSAQPDFRQKKQGAVDRAISDKLADQISVKDFGAKADGVTDDTQAFMAAISGAAGRPVALNGGTYALNLVLTEGKVKINGEGAMLKPFNPERPVITLQPAKYIYDVFIKSVEINGANLQGDGIYITNKGLNNGADFITLEEVVIKFCRYGFNVEGRSIWNKIYNCRMDWNTGGMRVKTGMPCNLWDITASTFNFNRDFGVWIQNDNAALEGFKNFKFQSCNFDGNGEGNTNANAPIYGGYFDGMEMLILDNMYVEGNGKHGEGYGIKLGGILGRGFRIDGGWFGDCKYPIVIEGQKKWGTLSNLMADSRSHGGLHDIILRSDYVNDEPKITLSNCFGRVNVQPNQQGNLPVNGVDWYPDQGSSISMQNRDWLKIFANTKDVKITKIEGISPGRVFGLINYTRANHKVIIDGSMMHDGKSVNIEPNATIRFLADGYPTTGKLRVI
jgi:hypothetical protein